MNFEKNTSGQDEQDPTFVEPQEVAPEAPQHGTLAMDNYWFSSGHIPDSLTQPPESMPEEEA